MFNIWSLAIIRLGHKHCSLFVLTIIDEEKKKFSNFVTSWGSGNLWDGRVLAAFGNVLVITFNYRLGILGESAADAATFDRLTLFRTQKNLNLSLWRCCWNGYLLSTAACPDRSSFLEEAKRDSLIKWPSLCKANKVGFIYKNTPLYFMITFFVSKKKFFISFISFLNVKSFKHVKFVGFHFFWSKSIWPTDIWSTDI